MPSVRKPSKAWLHSFQHRLIVSKGLAGGFGSINPLLKLWGLTAGGRAKAWHECRTARCHRKVLVRAEKKTHLCRRFFSKNF